MLLSGRGLRCVRGGREVFARLDVEGLEEVDEHVALLKRHCRKVFSQPISYWEDVAPDGLFLAWLAEK